jgi:isopenicillin N synthase-like dioxygenase
MSSQAIPTISAGDLLSGERQDQRAADQAIALAAQHTGFLLLGDLPTWAYLDATQRQSLLRIFSLPEDVLKRLWLRKFEASQPNIYRGWFPLQNGFPTYKEGIDIGPDLVWPELALTQGDPLREPSPLPTEQELPGWRVATAQYYQAMHRLSAAIMQSVARGLGLPEHSFDAAFVQGISTLRFIRYPVRSTQSLHAVGDEAMWAEHAGQRYYLTGRPHADTGFLTLLAQNGVGGLQALHRDGHWLDVAPTEGTLVVNFGKVLQRWTAGRVQATVHRVLGKGQERFSIPYFYEPRADAIIAPLDLSGAEAFDPFYYGDHLWETITTQNVEFRGIGHLRQPMGSPAAHRR